MISRSEDLRLGSNDKPWGFVQPDDDMPPFRRFGWLLVLLPSLLMVTLALQSPTSSQQALLTAFAGVALLAAVTGLICSRIGASRDRLNGQLAAEAIRKEMARSPANDRLFAVVLRDAGSHLELLAFFQEGNGAQRLETIRAPRTGDGSKYTETDIRLVRTALERHFSIAQIDDLNVVRFGAMQAPVSTERTQQSA